jgi:hypothetical protein
MKVYIGNKQLDQDVYKVITEYNILNYLADDSECTEIIFDGVFRTLPILEIEQAIDLAVRKLRMSGSIKIVDVDFDLMISAYKKIGDLTSLNNSLFKESGIRSFVNNEMILNMLQKYSQIVPFKLDIKNIEFIMEFKKK